MIVKSLSLTKILFLVLLFAMVAGGIAKGQTNRLAEGQVDGQIDGPHDLVVTSSAVKEGEEMPIEFTGDGAGVSPPITWSKGPAETKSYAVNLWHAPKGDKDGEIKSYWLIYDIPADVTSLPKNASGIGVMGYNDKDRQEYDPMRSQGPGTKEYHITVHALSEMLDLPEDEKVGRADLLKKMVGITLANGTLDFQYTRHRAISWWWVIGLVLAALVATAIWFKFAPESMETPPEDATDQ